MRIIYLKITTFFFRLNIKYSTLLVLPAVARFVNMSYFRHLIIKVVYGSW